MRIDIQILEWLNLVARHNPAVDVVITPLVLSHLLKGGVMMLFVWWGWFRASQTQENNRLHLTGLLLGALAAVAAARALATLLPHRVRPMHDSALDLTPSAGMPEQMLSGWSSFPSDHAALFGCIAVGMFYVSRRAGIVATTYCTLFILLPRIYTGLHYPSDLLAGFVLGAAAAWLLGSKPALNHVATPIYRLSSSHPGLFYPAMFLLTYQMATLFDGTRTLGRYVWLLLLKTVA